MKKLVLSVFMCVAFMTSTALVAQDSTPKKEGCCKEKTECTKDGEKKACDKNKDAKEKKCTKKDGEKKECCKSKKDSKEKK